MLGCLTYSLHSCTFGFAAGFNASPALQFALVRRSSEDRLAFVQSVRIGAVGFSGNLCEGRKQAKCNSNQRNLNERSRKRRLAAFPSCPSDRREEGKRSLVTMFPVAQVTCFLVRRCCASVTLCGLLLRDGRVSAVPADMVAYLSERVSERLDAEILRVHMCLHRLNTSIFSFLTHRM
jgi:hypothetical protein